MMRKSAPLQAVPVRATTAYAPEGRVEGAIELLDVCVHDVSATGDLVFLASVTRSRRQAVTPHANAFAHHQLYSRSHHHQTR